MEKRIGGDSPNFTVQSAVIGKRAKLQQRGVVSGAVCFWLYFKKPAVRLHSLDYWIVAFVLINFVSSAVGSSAPGLTLRWALQNSLAVIPYFLVRLLIGVVNGASENRFAPP